MLQTKTVLRLVRSLKGFTTTIALLFPIALSCAAQEPPSGPAVQPPTPSWLQEFITNPALMSELSHFIQRLQQDVKYPVARTESQLLPLVPDSTLGYAAFPNYGHTAHQALQIFQQELQANQPLRDWYRRNAYASGPKIEEAIDKFYEFSQYLGNEVAVSVSGDMSRHPSVIVFAEARKPGLKKFLEQSIQAFPGDQKTGTLILDPQELAAAKDAALGKGGPVLIRPDFVIAASDIATLRSFNARLDHNSREFASTPFGARIVREYRDGIVTVAAGDVQDFLKQVPMTDHDRQNLLSSGFADAKYFVSDQKTVEGQSLYELELSFTGPRHGPAAWLAPPIQPGSLDYVSPKALAVITLVLADPSKIFDEMKTLAGPNQPGPFAALPQLEQAMHISVRDDILAQLTGEITVEVDSLVAKKPAAKAILRVKDAARLQKALATLLVTSPFAVTPSHDGGFDSYTMQPPSNANWEIAYAFIDNSLIVTSGHDLLMDAVRLHKSGESLGKSKEFLAALPKGHSPGISALVYEDPVAMVQAGAAQASPQMAESLSKLNLQRDPVVACAYGEPSAIRAASTNSGVSAGAIMIVAAIAIPNLIRSRIAANEASAAGNLRTVNTAQVAYASIYPDRGFAPDLATLGPDPQGKSSAAHADMIDPSLGGATCTAGAWCTKSGYRFTIAGQCKQRLCLDYIAIATPVDTSTGARSFCTTSDGVIRYQTLEPLKSPISTKECQSWQPLE